MEQPQTEAQESQVLTENTQKSEEVTAVSTPVPSKVNSVIEIDSKGMVKAKNNAELLRYCGAMINSGMVPDRFDTPQKLFGALMFVRALGLPDTAIRQIANIHGVTSAFGDLPLALVQRSGKMEYFKEVWFDKDYNEIKFENKNLNAEAWGAVCFMSRGREDIQSFSFTLDDAEQAGLYPDKNPNKPWNKYTKIMLRYKARSLGLKSLFADITNGLPIAEYDFDIRGEETMKDVSNTNPAKELSNLIREEATS